MLKMKSWNDYVQRVVIHATDYLDFDGAYSVGGRQRYIRDLAKIVHDDWRREVLIVQKGRRDFSKTCDAGFPVIGIKSKLGAYGDPLFAFKAASIIQASDGVLYASGEDAWPFFRPGSKAIQHGVWWDGPQSWLVRRIQKHRAVTCMNAVKSMLCVDTNFINWLRCQGKAGLDLCNKCVYIPNYADLTQIVATNPDKQWPLRLICARRYEEKRGTSLFIDALGILKKEGFPFVAHISTVGGISEIQRRMAANHLGDEVTVTEDSMDRVLKRYGSADVAVVPTIWSEGTSLACVEAICAGVPVVATPVGGLGNLIIPGFNGLIATPSATSIADAIRQFSDMALLKTMGKNCLEMREALGRNQWRGSVLEWLKN